MTKAPTPAPRAAVDKSKEAVQAQAKAAEQETASMSSVGAELAPEATTFKEDGKVVLDAGGPYVAAAPQPTPAEAVAYPATGGLPDTGPHSKYVLGEDRGPKLYNENGERVNRDGDLIDQFGDRIPKKGVDENDTAAVAKRPVSKYTKAEMDAGKKALSDR